MTQVKEEFREWHDKLATKPLKRDIERNLSGTHELTEHEGVYVRGCPVATLRKNLRSFGWTKLGTLKEFSNTLLDLGYKLVVCKSTTGKSARRIATVVTKNDWSK